MADYKGCPHQAINRISRFDHWSGMPPKRLHEISVKNWIIFSCADAHTLSLRDISRGECTTQVLFQSPLAIRSRAQSIFFSEAIEVFFSTKLSLSLFLVFLFCRLNLKPNLKITLAASPILNLTSGRAVIITPT